MANIAELKKMLSDIDDHLEKVRASRKKIRAEFVQSSQDYIEIKKARRKVKSDLAEAVKAQAEPAETKIEKKPAAKKKKAKKKPAAKNKTEKTENQGGE